MASVPFYEPYALASHGRRIGAAALDAVFGAAVIGACGAAGFGVGLISAGGAQDQDGWGEIIWVLAGVFLGLMLGVLCWVVLTVWLMRRPGARNGQTFGKQLVGIRVARADGTPVGVGWALLREVVAKWLLVSITSSIVSVPLGYLDGGLLGLLVAIAVWYGPAFADDERRGLHDRLSGTRVVVATAAPGAAAPPSDADLWAATP